MLTVTIELPPPTIAALATVAHHCDPPPSHIQESGANFLIPSPITTSNELVTAWDPEVGKINPSEHKQLKLARSLTCGIIDRDLKPSSSETKEEGSHKVSPLCRME
ncbi:unnamed protein product [Camellia sinensis]